MLERDESPQLSSNPDSASTALAIPDQEDVAAGSVERRDNNKSFNFYMNLPGGWYREVNHILMNDTQGVDATVDKTRLFSAIDVLLATEFVSLKLDDIFEVLKRARKIEDDLILDMDIDEETRKALEVLKIKLFQHLDTLLNPLINRLTELGFKREDLIR